MNGWLEMGDECFLYFTSLYTNGISTENQPSHRKSPFRNSSLARTKGNNLQSVSEELVHLGNLG